MMTISLASREAVRLSLQPACRVPDGRRKYPPMNYLLEFLPDPFLKQIADHFGGSAATASRALSS